MLVFVVVVLVVVVTTVVVVVVSVVNTAIGEIALLTGTIAVEIL